MLPLRARYLDGLHGMRRFFAAGASGMSRWPRPQRVLAIAIGAVIAGVFLLDTWLFTCGFAGCPSAAAIRAYRPQQGSIVRDWRDREMGRLTAVRRINLPLTSVPQHVRDAFIATEDRRFYEHAGLDWRGVARAIVRNTMALGVREGFSTITMQVARNTFIDANGTRSVGRKLLELRYARLLERALTKDQILELYLNAIYLGNGVYGVEAASRDLFGKRVRDLSVAEGALLAALPKGPSTYTPRRNPDRALARRNLVLALMADQGFLSDNTVRRARRVAMPRPRRSWRPADPPESYALDLVRALVDSVLKATGEQGRDVVVYTTIDPIAQRAAQRAVQQRAREIGQQASGWWLSEDDPAENAVQGAMVAVDPRTGDIRAMVGGRSHSRGAFNRATRAHRQPGSAFKPFVYAAAIEAGLTPATLVDDAPISVDQGNGRTWTPVNYGEEYDGRMTLSRALARSSNVAAVRVSRTVGEPRVVEVARANGITSPLRAVPAVALGAFEVTPLELVTAYAPFANGGQRVRPRIVRRIERTDGSLLWSSDVEAVPVMDPRDAFQTTAMLRGVVDGGTGRVIRDMGVDGPVAGKTGTTNDGIDTWFVGYTPTLVAGFWFGYDAPRSLGDAASGARMAAPAWARFYRDGWRDRSADWDVPDGLVSADIDPVTGALANDWCPLRTRAWFRVGTAPTQRCEEHAGHGFPSWVDNLDDEIAERIARLLRRWAKGRDQ